MPLPGNVILCIAAMTALWTLIGLPAAMRLVDRWYGWLLAPALGWALASVVALPLLEIAGMSRPLVMLVAALGSAGALCALWRQNLLRMVRMPIPLLLGVMVAAVLAFIPVFGILPKPTPEGMTLASPIFDHSKIAMVDEMIRSGVPAINPFFGDIGAPDRVAYYYLWHFSAAVLAVMTGVTGWEADAALTGFTAFASLLLMIGVAMQCGARPWAGVLVVLLAATASLRTILEWIWPDAASVIGEPSGFGGWLFQTSWAPQHVASAMCVVLAGLQISRLAQRPRWGDAIALGLIAAAAFQSSAWVGGIVLAVAAMAIGLLQLWSLHPGSRWPFLKSAAIAAALAALLAIPFIYDQSVSATLRGNATLIAFMPVPVLGTAWPESLRRLLDPPAYWLVYLPLEFPAFYLAGLLGTCALFADRKLDDAGQQSLRALSLLAAIGLMTAWLAASVIGDNNDLGWRAVLPAVMALIALAAALISRWPLSLWSRAVAGLAALGFLLSLPGTFKIVRENLSGLRKPSEHIFATTPEMWEAVRRYTPATERIASNPLFLRDMTPWPVNISWALLADRRSCYAGSELAIPFAPIPASRRAAIEALFVRVFEGTPGPDDVRQLAEHFRCDTVVITAQDGAWQRDPFTKGNLYRLVDSRTDRWRIYRKNQM